MNLGERVLKDLNSLETEILSEKNIWYSLKIIPYRTTDNIIDGVVITLIDIHKVKQADKIQRFATVLEDANDAITVQDFEGRFLSWNKGAERMYGWTESEALKMNIAALVPKNKQKEIKTLTDQIKNNIPIKSFKTNRITKDGRTLRIWLTATPLKNEQGRPIEMATTERDLAWLEEKGDPE